jgi:guanosine-3',5'-bis(diphosphate) 3'-pyrophosphohydrolase
VSETQIGSTTREGQLQELFARLDSMGVSTEIQELLRNDLQVEENIERLRGEARSVFTQHDCVRLEEALAFALSAHAGQTQSLTPNKGLTTIPYSNHVVQVARYALVIGADADAVAVALLHDVLEDTDTQAQTIELRFGSVVLAGVEALTRKEGVSRAEFLEHVSGLPSPHREVKFVDRYHNLVRGFTTEKRAYLDRYLKETESVYRPIAESMDLSPLPVPFDRLVQQLGAFRDRLEQC